MTDRTDFIKYQPQITEVTIVEAAKSYGRGDDILSLSGRRTAIDAFVLLLSTDSERIGPFILNSVCARELCSILISEGFGVP